MSQIESIVVQMVGQQAETETPLMEAGLDSLASSELVDKINFIFCVELPATLLFDHPSVISIS